ncbi:hypothetical protein ISS07_03340 [Candidatus Woesearchaeota archaeon]|nr:hypothetical protein [Candidatus Woesearchaeota archaeon]
MKDSFEELVTALKKSREKCPWSIEQEIEDFGVQLKNEVKEMDTAIKNKDYKNLKEELGDILMDLAYMAVLAEEKNLFTIKSMIEDVKKKLIRRKPWVYGDEKVKDSDDAVRRWNEIKKEEVKTGIR